MVRRKATTEEKLLKATEEEIESVSDRAISRMAAFAGTGLAVWFCFVLTLGGEAYSIWIWRFHGAENPFKNVSAVIAWISSAFLQLVYLPILQYSQRKNDAESKKREARIISSIVSLRQTIERLNLEIKQK